MNREPKKRETDTLDPRTVKTSSLLAANPNEEAQRALRRVPLGLLLGGPPAPQDMVRHAVQPGAREKPNNQVHSAKCGPQIH